MNVFSLTFDNKTLLKAELCWKKTMSIDDKIDKLFEGVKLPHRQKMAEYTLYPYLFHEDFPKVTDEQISQLTQAGVMYYSYLMSIDGLVDGHKELNCYEFLYRNYESQMAMKELTDLFGYNSRFWDYFYKYNKEFIDSIIIEQQHTGIIKRYEQSEFERVARGKSAVAKLAVAGLGVLSQEYDKIHILEETQDYLAESIQLHDDLKDWKDDLDRKNYSWLLTELIYNMDKAKEINYTNISYELFAGRYDEAILDEAIRLCDKAMLVAKNSNSWIKCIRNNQKRLDRLRDDLTSIRKEPGPQYLFFNEKKTKHSVNEIGNEVDRVFNSFHNNILNQWKKEYKEMVHWMAFPNDSGFTCIEECQSGIIFQHSFILNLLYEIKEKGFPIDPCLLNVNIDYWINNKHRNFEKGFAYFPFLPELSPDIDTSSEVIRVLLRQGSLSEDLLKEIDFIVSNNKKDDGSFDTWIIDKNDNSQSTKKALNAARKLWGTAPDPEVIANFIYTLYLIDKEAYKDLITEGTTWLLSTQNSHGYWESTWYVGNYYGSYVCARLFNTLKINNANVKKLYDYIMASQNQNGSWGIANGNPQDTALAIASLCYLNNYYSDDITSNLRSAINYLMNTFDFNLGSWYSNDFIVMDTGRVTGKTYILKYKSAILTSVICSYGMITALNHMKKAGEITFAKSN